MRPSTPLLTLFRFLLPPALIGLVYLYTYPVLTGCAFPAAAPARTSCHISGSGNAGRAATKAPLRFLALGDPQLEGDTSLPSQNLPNVERVWRSFRSGDFGGVGEGLGGVVTSDFPRALQVYRKKLDLWGNDMYLAHVYATVKWWTRPTDVVVLGDLLGSQWIGDGEFERRAGRFWGRVFRGAGKVGGMRGGRERDLVIHEARDETGEVICVAGNHDVGYAGDLDEKRVERFERRFGPVNWEMRLKLSRSSKEENALDDVPSPGNPSAEWSKEENAVSAKPSKKENAVDGILSAVDPSSSEPELRIVVLNSMNLDEPAYKPDLRTESLDFLDRSLLNSQPPPNNQTAVLVLTHIPLHKSAGVCVDAPFFSYFPANEGGGIREQNHLSEAISHRMLDGMGDFGSAFVLNGHDHEGCDTYHYRSKAGGFPIVGARSRWEGEHYRSSRSVVDDLDVQGVREVTVQSMMGSYGGNAGLLSVWFDEEVERWRFEYDTCVFGVQHIWWAIHVLVLIEVALGIGGLAALVLEEWGKERETYKMKTA